MTNNTDYNDDDYERFINNVMNDDHDGPHKTSVVIREEEIAQKPQSITIFVRRGDYDDAIYHIYLSADSDGSLELEVTECANASSDHGWMANTYPEYLSGWVR